MNVMSPAVWERAKEIFSDISELPQAQRAAAVRQRCGGDEELLTLVTELLANDDEQDGFLDRPALEDSFFAEVASESQQNLSFREGELIAGRFRVTRHLGSGGMGDVFEAEDLSLEGSLTALKTIRRIEGWNAALEARFRREVKLARKVTHSNVCRIHEFFIHETDGGPDQEPRRVCFFAMELLTGPSLLDAMREPGIVTGKEAIHFLEQISDGLAAAHAAGVVHGDLKLANVLLDVSDGVRRAVITDFGLAKQASTYVSPEGASGETIPGAGTLMYMAPELLNSQPPSPASDVFAFGVLAIYLLTGKSELVQQHSEGYHPAEVRPHLRNLPAPVQRLLLRCIAKRPEDRPQDARALAKAWTKANLPAWERYTRAGFFATLAAGAAAMIAGRNGNAPATGGTPSLAVLPFKSSSELEVAADGLAEQIIRALARARNLKMIARASSFQYKGKDLDFAAIAARLAVDLLLTGEVSAEAGMMRIVVRLMRADGTAFWSESFEQKASALFQAQQEIAARVARQLQLGYATSTRPAPSPAAYELYLKGRYYWNKRDTENLKRALVCYQQALQIQPDFAEAWAGLADTYHQASGSFIENREAIARATEAADKALALDDRLAEAHLSRAILRQRVDWDWPGAMAGFQKALEMEPGNSRAHHWLAGFLNDLGDSAQAIQEIELARSLDPLSFAVTNASTMFHYLARRYDDAIRIGSGLLAVEPRYILVYPLIAESWFGKGDWRRAMEYHERGNALAADDVILTAYLALGCLRCGQRARGLEAIQRLIHRPVPPPPFFVAMAFCGDHDAANAIHWLERGLAEHDPAMTLVKVHPAMEILRGNPRYQAILHSMHLDAPPQFRGQA